MALNTVIFDMDGLLIDSEPCWEEAGAETLKQYGIVLTNQQYQTTTGLRTKEWIDWWFTHFNIDKSFSTAAGDTIVAQALEKIKADGVCMPGVEYIFNFFKERNFHIGLATSSPVELIKIVTEKLKIHHLIEAYSSAEELEHSKPHPQVYLNCAEKLNVSPLQCVCFEDSFNGMISAKAARMKCVVVPAPQQWHEDRWGAADLKLASLTDFNDELLKQLQ